MLANACPVAPLFLVWGGTRGVPRCPAAVGTVPQDAQLPPASRPPWEAGGCARCRCIPTSCCKVVWISPVAVPTWWTRPRCGLGIGARVQYVPAKFEIHPPGRRRSAQNREANAKVISIWKPSMDLELAVPRGVQSQHLEAPRGGEEASFSPCLPQIARRPLQLPVSLVFSASALPVSVHPWS